ncbi:MAG: stage II sporulation protein M [Eubacterium sp.]|nr:stage II sporulation protein M [Eubacterium sp.]
MDELKNVNFQIVNKKKLDFNDFFECFRENIYSILFYVFGLALGAYLYKAVQNDSINQLLMLNAKSLFEELIANLIVYLSIWLLLVLMGFSLIGFSVMNAIPIFVGLYYGLKSACYFTIHGGKGIGYITLAIAPVSALFLALIIYSISYNSKLSKSILTTIKDRQKDFTIAVKPLLLQIIIQLVLFLLLSLINSALSIGIRNIIAI